MVILFSTCGWVCNAIYLVIARLFIRCCSRAYGNSNGNYLSTRARFSGTLVVAVSTSISAKKGLLIRNRTNFEEARNLNAVVFDKTGTLTEGRFGVTNIVPNEGYKEEEDLSFAARLEQNSEHPIASGIVNDAKEKEINFGSITDFESITGKGIEGKVDGKRVNVVSPGYVNENNLDFDRKLFNDMSEEGKTVVF